MYRNLIKETDPQETTLPNNKPPTQGIPQTRNHTELITNKGTAVRPISPSLHRLPPNKRNEVYLIFSRAQIRYQLRFCTVHLAFALYVQCSASPLSSSIPDPYLTVSCLYLAMKYEQIYPPGLSELSGYLGHKIHLKEYRLHELAVLEILGMNLSLQNAATILDQTMVGPRWKGVIRFMGFYLLEIALVQSNIYDNYTSKEISTAISYILNISYQSSEEKTHLGKKESKKTKKLAALLIKARTAKNELTDAINGKYQRDMFYKVSTLPLNIA